MLGVADDRYTEHEHTYAKWCSLLANDRWLVHVALSERPPLR